MTTRKTEITIDRWPDTGGPSKTYYCVPIARLETREVGWVVTENKDALPIPHDWVRAKIIMKKNRKRAT